MQLKPITANHGGEKKIYLLKPRGFCAGVVRAIDVVKIALNLYGPPVYVRKEIVHNKHVVDELRAMGAIFVEELEEVPTGARAIFSAHGVSPEVRKEAKERNLAIIDATCPLVTKVHLEAVKFAREGYTIVLIGHKNHDEVIGTLGEAPSRMILVESVEDVDALNIEDPERVAYLTQTTLSLDETVHIVARLQQRFPMIRSPKSQDICYATENRQMAVKGVAQYCELLLVVGSANSSNSRRLVEVGQNCGVPSYLVNDWTEVDPLWLDGVTNVGVTAGASAPEYLVENIVTSLRDHGYRQLEEVEMVDEDVRFSLPPELNPSSGTGAGQLVGIGR
ncbi:MAG TPA: 4-hydroxy-3-methylbut-2-enyl diphosphate reductase [Bryobacteraceae bacterium]|jgi:4-hydroxy-3-methylbut-2-enyl diphosphate reductase|nr:4-hydroxy-3-methylbut-2-enyl diphosphate reductase [Bryobacteraceae bacterium]